jgi:hypothetical protein
MRATTPTPTPALTTSSGPPGRSTGTSSPPMLGSRMAGLNEWVHWLRHTYGLPVAVSRRSGTATPNCVGTVRAAPALAVRDRPRSKGSAMLAGTATSPTPAANASATGPPPAAPA